MHRRPLKDTAIVKGLHQGSDKRCVSDTKDGNGVSPGRPVSCTRLHYATQDLHDEEQAVQHGQARRFGAAFRE